MHVQQEGSEEQSPGEQWQKGEMSRSKERGEPSSSVWAERHGG